MAKYNKQGHLESYVFHINKRVKSSDEVFDSKGGLLKGRIDVGWRYWNDPDVLLHHYHLVKSDGTVDRCDRAGINLALNFTHSIDNDNGYIGFFDRTAEQFGGVGIIAVYIEYTDLKGWFEVYPKKPKEMEYLQDNQRTVYVKFPDRANFRVLAKVGDDYDDTDIDYDVPFDLLNQHAWMNFDIGVSCTVELIEENIFQISLVGGATQFEKVWVKYN